MERQTGLWYCFQQTNLNIGVRVLTVAILDSIKQ